MMKRNLAEKEEIIALKNGEVKAFNALYARYHKPVHANILKFVHSPELAMEILQDVFLSLWQYSHKIDPNQSVGGWLFVTSYHRSLNALRDKLKESIDYVAEYPITLASEEDTRFVEETFEQQMALLEEAVGILSKRKQEVFRMCRYEGRSKEDVALLLGITPQSVSDYLKQANKSIKKHIAIRYSSYVGKTLLPLFLIYMG